MDRGAGQEVPRLRIDRVRDPLYFVLDILRVPRQPTLVRCEQSLDCCRCCSAMHALRRLCFLILRRWATNVVGLLIMALMGEWLCVQRELADIPLSESLALKTPPSVFTICLRVTDVHSIVIRIRPSLSHADAMRGRVDAMRGGDAVSTALNSVTGAAGSAGLGSGRSGGNSLVVEMSSSSGVRALTTTTRLLGTSEGDSGR